MEIEVQLIWHAVLNQQRISTDADFSAIGGNMMHAVIINAVMRYAYPLASGVLKGLAAYIIWQ